MLSRRRFFEISGTTGASLLVAHLFPGCAMESVAAQPELPVDPMGRWWLSGNYAPVDDEIESFDLAVEGAIPPELDGVFLRNGANPVTHDSVHWFVGDGMLHGVRLSGGRALWYRNRFVQTLALEARMGDSLAANRANTSLVHHAGRTLALYEVGAAHEVRAGDLSTVGVHDFGGALRRPMSAHPKIDPATGEMHFIGYAPFAPFLTYHVVDASGALVRSDEIELDHAPMMHEFQLTPSYAVFLDLPVHFDASLLTSNGFPFRWAPEAGARIGLLRRDATSPEVRWIDVDVGFAFHTWNAYEDAEGRVVLEGCRLASIWERGIEDASESPIPWRWTLDPVSGTSSEGAMSDLSADFPRIDTRRQGLVHEMAYALRFPEGGGDQIAQPNGIVKLARTSGAVDAWDAGPALQPDEALFVPASASAGEDEGYVLSMVFDRTTRTSHVAILDAQDLRGGPIARIQMPRRVPFGFHGGFFPA